MTITQTEAQRMLIEDAQTAVALAQKFHCWPKLNTRARQNVFVEMCFNLGPGRLAGFKNFLAAIEVQDWHTAAQEMLNSKWATQVGKRATTLAEIMKHGEYSIRSSS